ncbi:unnamed protein product [Ceutorhynchus assimilis]|uniref:MADF domain-containing protein n=1 Tax=Ceutorhynchus assimilis TaxID=467358 RepID=A0A9N9MWP1_9CUCU|nr:unnamed protein product [Ceutorhynchus assimilis]
MDRKKEQIISAVFQKPALWDRSKKAHYNRYILKECWNQVASTCEITVADARKAWKILRQQFKLQFERLPPRRSGDPAPEDHVKWPYFKSLLFLRDNFERRHATDSSDDDSREFEGGDDTQHDTGDVLSSSTQTTTFDDTSQTFANVLTVEFVTLRSSTNEKSDNLDYQERSAPTDQTGQGLLEIEKEKLKMSTLNNNDEDVRFFASLLPHVKKLSPVDKFTFRAYVENMITEMVYGVKNGTASSYMEHRNPSASNFNPTVPARQNITYDGDRSSILVQAIRSAGIDNDDSFM